VREEDNEDLLEGIKRQKHLDQSLLAVEQGQTICEVAHTLGGRVYTVRSPLP